jgi:proton glutamate symport protein
MVFRWLALASLIYYAFLKRSLTTTILISMLIGVEIGLDFPAFSQNLKVLSQLFLRLIKSIIAPLLFGTLVYGIAGHSNIKQVGRMGWKSLLYFEVVTTIALFIGLAAINLSKAGEGIVLPPGSHADLMPAQQTNLYRYYPPHLSRKHCQKHLRRCRAGDCGVQYSVWCRVGHGR